MTLLFFPPFFFQGFKIDINCKQLTVDFVNQSVLQISSQDVESKRSHKTDFAEQLGAMNKSWQILQGLVAEKVSQVASAVHGSSKLQGQVHSVKKINFMSSIAALGPGKESH